MGKETWLCENCAIFFLCPLFYIIASSLWHTVLIAAWWMMDCNVFCKDFRMVFGFLVILSVWAESFVSPGGGNRGQILKPSFLGRSLTLREDPSRFFAAKHEWRTRYLLNLPSSIVVKGTLSLRKERMRKVCVWVQGHLS